MFKSMYIEPQSIKFTNTGYNNWTVYIDDQSGSHPVAVFGDLAKALVKSGVSGIHSTVDDFISEFRAHWGKTHITPFPEKLIDDLKAQMIMSIEDYAEDLTYDESADWTSLNTFIYVPKSQKISAFHEAPSCNDREDC